MSTEVKSDKLKQVTIGGKANVKPLDPNEREEKICYLRDLFRLSFRVYEGDLRLPADDVVDLHDRETAGFGELSEDELASFSKGFAELGAPEMFYKLCLEYCQDQLKVLKQRSKGYWAILDKFAKNDPQVVAQMSRKARRRYEYLYKFYQDRVNCNDFTQQELKKQMVAIREQLAQLGQPNHQQKGAVNKERQADTTVTPTIER